MAILKGTLTSAVTATEAVRGDALVGFSGNNANESSSISYQVKYGTGVTSGNFEVVLQGGFEDGGTVTWGEVATITQDNVNDPVTLPIGLGLSYRFSRTSGVTVDVLLG